MIVTVLHRMTCCSHNNGGLRSWRAAQSRRLADWQPGHKRNHDYVETCLHRICTEICPQHKPWTRIQGQVLTTWLGLISNTRRIVALPEFPPETGISYLSFSRVYSHTSTIRADKFLIYWHCHSKTIDVRNGTSPCRSGATRLPLLIRSASGQLVVFPT